MSEYNDVFAFPYKVLTKLGLWATDSKNSVVQKLYTFYQIWAIFFLIFTINCCFWDLYLVMGDVHKASTNLSATMTISLLVWKNSLALYNIYRLKRLQKLLDHDLNDETDYQNRIILIKAAKESKASHIGIYILSISTISCWLFADLLRYDSEKRKLPLPIYVPWANEKSPNYETAYILHIFAGYFVTIDVISLNLTIFGNLARICADYDILLRNTEKIREWYENLPGNFSKTRALTEEENLSAGKLIASNVRHHQKIIHCIGEAEHCYIHMMLVQFGGSAILITVVSLDLILVSAELDSRVLTLIIFSGLLWVDIFLFCAYGGRLINKSYEFLNVMYSLPWECFNKKNRKSIEIIMLKCQNAPKLTVEKIADLDLFSMLKLTKIVYNILYLLLHLASNSKEHEHKLHH